MFRFRGEKRQPNNCLQPHGSQRPNGKPSTFEMPVGHWTQESWMACCCSRGLAIPETEANMAWEPLPPEGREEQSTCPTFWLFKGLPKELITALLASWREPAHSWCLELLRTKKALGGMITDVKGTERLWDAGRVAERDQQSPLVKDLQR